MTEQSQVVLQSVYVLPLAALITLVASWVVLRRYRTAVVRLMSAPLPAAVGAGPLLPPPTGPAVLPAGPGPVAPQPVPATATPGRPGGPAADRAAGRAARRRAAHVAVALGAGLLVGLSYALFSLWANGIGLTWTRLVVLGLVQAWPAVPGVWIASDGDRRLTGLTAAALLVVPFAVSVTHGNGLLATSVYWLLTNALGSVVVGLMLTRAFRAVGACLLGVVLTALVGAVLATQAVVTSQAVGSTVAGAAVAAGVRDATVVLLAVALGGMAVAAAGGWGGLLVLAGWYRRRRVSDHMILLGSVCLFFCVDYSTAVGTGTPRDLAVGLALFAVIVAAAVVAFRVLLPPVPAPPRLLVLRVFGDARRSGPLLDAVTARWRFGGPVRMIGGPDLVVANAEVDEVLTFLGGRLRGLFVTGPDDLRARTGALGAPDRPDPDGRYRVDEWFCLEGTWQPAVEVLLGRSDAVLLDLRGFTPARQGTRHELDLLSRTGALARTVLAVDATTDEALVGAVLAGSPYRPRVVRVDGLPRGTAAARLTTALLAPAAR